MTWKKILSLGSVTGFSEERKRILLCMSGNRERRGKEKRKKGYFFFL